MVNTRSDRQESAALETSRKAALYFTMAVAVLTAVAELARQRAKSPSAGLVANILDILLVVGGVAMGVLYLLHLSKRRATAE